MRTSLNRIAAAAILLSVFLNGFSQQVAKTISNSTSPDGLIGFLEFRPSDYGSQKHPLIIFLHGVGERGNGTSQINYVANNGTPNYCAHGATMRFTVGGQTSSFVVLSPQLSSQYGYWPTFYVKEMIKYAKANLQIDPNRIYVTGLSLGGGGVWRVITDTENFDNSFDGTIAAAAPVCGTQEEQDGNFCNTIGTNHLPVWAFHSMDDGVVNVSATQHAQYLATQCGITPASKFTYYQSGNHGGAWTNAYDTGHITTTVNVNGNQTSFTANPNLYEWFLSNTRSGATTTTQTNTAPVANAGAAQIIALPLSTVTLTGSGTGTNGATITSYSWAKTSGPSSGTISLPLLNSTVVTGLVQGTYIFTLTVTDNHGLTNTANVTITVNAAPAAAPNQSPLCNAGANQTITLPVNTITLDGSASKDADGYLTGYEWTQMSGTPLNVSNRLAAVTTVSGVTTPGTYNFILKVTDNSGAIGFSSMIVTVNGVATPVNTAPVASAGGAQTITLPASTLTLSGNGTGTNGATVSSYAWTKTSGPSAGSISNPASASSGVTGLVQGVYVFTLTVTDNHGLTGAASVTETVNAQASAAPNQSPFCNAGANQIITLPTNAVTLDGSASNDPDGYLTGYEWTQMSGTSLSISNRLASVTTVSGFTPGTYNFILKVTDNSGAIGFSSMTITVNAAATAPSGALLGYIKISTGPYQACDDASSSGRTAVYGTAIANGSILYTDAAKTQAYNGGWNWYSFTPVLGGSTTYAFAVYPTGGILLLRNCATGNYVRVAGATATATTNTTTAEEDIATLKRLKDSATASIAAVALNEGKLSIYPNPVRTNATVEWNSTEDGAATVNIYNASSVQVARYTWQAVKGRNVYLLKNISGLTNGLYIIDIRDSKGKSKGTLKFLKM